MFELDQNAIQGAKIKVVGVGGSGCNAVNTMIRMGLEGVEFITANTDKQALEASLAPTKMTIGTELTKGLGAGANPEVGRKAALEDYAAISELLAGADMVFITAGMGGGTGTGAAPIFAKIAKEVGALTVGVVTKPFGFEGKKRMKSAEQGLAWLRESVDSLIVIPNNRLIEVSGATLSILDAFKKADEVLLNAVQGISDLINHTGLINSDFADVRTIMQNKGLAIMGIGSAEGENRAVQAATSAISSPLLEDVSIEGATGVIINVTGGSNLTIHEVNEATSLIMEAAHEDAEIIFGTVIDESLKDAVRVTVIATGLGVEAERELPAQKTLAQPAPTAATLNVAAANTFAQPSQPQTFAAQPAPAQATQMAQAVTPPPFNFEAAPATEPVVAMAAVTPIEEPTPGMSTMVNRPMGTGAEGGDLARARAIAQRLGITNLTDDEYDIPTYLRRQQEREV